MPEHPFYQDPIPAGAVGSCDYCYPDGDICGLTRSRHEPAVMDRRIRIKPTSPASRVYRIKRGHGVYLDARPASYGLYLGPNLVGEVSYSQRRVSWVARVRDVEREFDTFREACDHARAELAKEG